MSHTDAGWRFLACTLLAVSGGSQCLAADVPSLWSRHKGVDWPSFLGPERNNQSPETGIITPWPPTGPKLVWQMPLGASYGIGSVSRGRFYQFDRFGDQARLTCVNAETGQKLWSFEYPSKYEDAYQYEGGPRCSPVVDDDRVYIYGAEGMLYCLDSVNGQQRWKVDTTHEFHVVPNFFGVGSTPIIEGDLLLVMVGGSPPDQSDTTVDRLDRVTSDGSGVIAFDKQTGVVIYKLGNELASYASIQTATIAGRRWGFAFGRRGLLGFEPTLGKSDFDYPWRAPILESVNASTPVVVDDEVFISETYGPGSSLLRVHPGGYEVVWSDASRRRGKSFQAHWNTPVYHQGYLYGCSGRNMPDAELRCIEWKTGRVMWNVATGARSSMLLVDNHLVCLTERGELLLIRPNPLKLEIVSRVVLRDPKVPYDPDGFGAPSMAGQLLQYPCWAAPILSHGLLYVRGRDRLVCLELIPE